MKATDLLRMVMEFNAKDYIIFMEFSGLGSSFWLRVYHGEVIAGTEPALDLWIKPDEIADAMMALARDHRDYRRVAA